MSPALYYVLKGDGHFTVPRVISHVLFCRILLVLTTAGVAVAVRPMGGFAIPIEMLLAVHDASLEFAAF
jgi:hypothetical protein